MDGKLPVIRLKDSRKGNMKFIDLFAGVGGFRYGLTKANKKFKCVWSNEWNTYANSVYRHRFGSCDDNDIRTVPAGSIPDHELLCAGFPCQSFSIAGKRRGFDDTRGTLFFDIARILKEKRPRLCLLENVKGLLSHDDGRTIKTIFTTLVELGYDLQWQVLNSKDFGVPQNRERIFIIGNLRNTPRPEVFPFGESDGTPIPASARSEGEGKRVRRQDISAAIDANYYKGQGSTRQMIEMTQGVSDAQRVYDPKGIAKTLTLTGQDIHGVSDGIRIRRLTPIETERLQGFPDNWTQYGVNGELISDSQRYRMTGNAVSTPVIEAIGRRLLW